MSHPHLLTYLMKHNPFSFVKNLLQGTRELVMRKPAAPAAASRAKGSGTVPSSTLPEPEGAPGDLTVELPLSAILQMLPSHLQGRLRYAQAGSRNISVPLNRILPQLAHGDVRISFGELRQAAPYFFSHGGEEDATPVQLPLAEIVRRIDPALLLVPTQQSPATGLARPTPLAEETRAAVDAKAGLARRDIPAVTSPLAAGALQRPERPGPALHAGTVAAASPEAEPITTPMAQARFEWEGPGPVQRDLKVAATGPRPDVEPAEPLSSPAPLVLRLGILAVSWPEAVRREIDQLHLGEAHVALPMDLVAQGLKRGRLVFSWQTLRGWIQPAAAPTVSAHDSLELELALKAVAPLFLARQREGNKPRPRLEAGNEIPDLFVGGQPPAAGTGASPSRNGHTRPALAPEAPGPARPKPGTVTAAQSATPQQLVNRATQLQGVDGALVALRDGLLVASRFPAHLNADNIAAFLPQIFGKLGQYTQELHMGDLNALEFLVGKVPWKVFRLNEVFFVAFGREGEPLPSAPLAALITELGQAQ